jgi:hypothetical protein
MINFDLIYDLNPVTFLNNTLAIETIRYRFKAPANASAVNIGPINKLQVIQCSIERM